MTTGSGAEGLPRTLGRYVIVEHLASGGMGSVYLALQSTRFHGLDRVCVLKTIRPQFAMNANVLSRFIDEARTSLLLSHKNLCTTIDVDNADGMVVLAMEHIAGRNLRNIFDVVALDQSALEPADIVAIACQALEGLEHAHNLTDPRTGEALGLVHRDISPHNVMVSFAGDVKVIDFGVARSRIQTVQTAQGAIVGKFRYMAPEQIASQPVDRRADVACIGIILIELLSGERFYGDTKTEELWTLWDEEFTSPALEKVPLALRPILERAVAREPNERFGSAASLRDALLAVLPAARSANLAHAMARIFPGDEDAWRKDLQELYRRAEAVTNDGAPPRSQVSADAPTAVRAMSDVQNPAIEPTMRIQIVPDVTTEPSSTNVRSEERLENAPTMKNARAVTTDPVVPGYFTSATGEEETGQDLEGPSTTPLARPTTASSKKLPLLAAAALAIVAVLVVVAIGAGDDDVTLPVGTAPILAPPVVTPPVVAPPVVTPPVVTPPVVKDKWQRRTKAPVELPARPKLLGERIRYLEKHCAARSCASSIAGRTRDMTTLPPAEIQRLRVDIEACLDACGAPR